MSNDEQGPVENMKDAAKDAADKAIEKVGMDKSAVAKVADQKLTALRRFFKMESAGGIMLMIATVLAFIFANSALSGWYDYFLHAHITITVDGFGIDKSVHHWINDGLMAIFFLLVGLEIKREILEGELSSVEQALLPAIAAAGGVVIPALIFSYVNWGDENAMRGWAIPTATDIAFALGILALFGKRVPIALKIFLTAVAVIDDLIAITIIAIFYTSGLSIKALLFAGVFAVVLLLLNLRGERNGTYFVVLGVAMWVAVLKSGVHATLAGVLLGFLIPHHCRRNKREQSDGYSLLKHLEHLLHPWVAFLVLPIFAFANAGVSFKGMTADAFTDPIPIGIAAGLFFGKQIGIYLLSKVAILLNIAKLPDQVNWKQFYGVCMLCGVGFTMSLFIGGLAYDTEFLRAEARLGVMTGSLISAIVGSVVLAFSLPSVEERMRQKQAALKA